MIFVVLPNMDTVKHVNILLGPSVNIALCERATWCYVGPHDANIVGNYATLVYVCLG
jgi:hypothetical protein